MNLRNAEHYHIGLDLGTGSVGWAVVDDDGQLLHFKGQPTWGSRLFPSAETAEGTRMKRGQRRRYDRRRQRIEALQGFFADEMSAVDPDFFIRMRQSRLLQADKSEAIANDDWQLFDSSTLMDPDLIKDCPTINHLRKRLMESDEKADVRLVYLALHHIVKYRGNFLHEDEGSSLKATNASASLAVERLAETLLQYKADYTDEVEGGLAFNPDAHGLAEALEKRGLKRGDRRDRLARALNPQGKPSTDMAKELAKACLGYQFKPSKLFLGVDVGDAESLQLDSEDKVDEFLDGSCPDECRPLFEAMQLMFSSYELAHILKGAGCISDAMVASYDQHKKDLKCVKELVREYLGPDAYRELFRGPKDGGGRYDINRLPAKSYTAYICGEKLANRKGCTHEDFIKNLRKVLATSPELTQDPRYKVIEPRLLDDDSGFLGKQRTSENGAIPYQLHLEEMDAIIDRQGRYYPFLLEHRDELEKLVSSRIPYYVGPLNTAHDPAGEGGYPENAVCPSRKYGWAVRREGMEGVPARPWNVQEVIDTDKTAELFIRRMTGTCSYLLDEPVLPRRSLLYEEFCVLNELNGMKVRHDGHGWHRFAPEDCRGIVREVFEAKNTYSKRGIEDWLKRQHGWGDAEVKGFAGVTGLEARLSTRRDFCRLFGVESLDDAPLTRDEMEEIVLWSTLFEDRDLFCHRLEAKYGSAGKGVLGDKAIKRLVGKRYVGWGRLSRKLLRGITVPASVSGGRVSVMDVLRDGNPCERCRVMNFMETITDQDLGFPFAIDEANKERIRSRGKRLAIDDLHGSPANRRTVNQALRVVEEIVGIAGHVPDSICIETTRDEDERKKGHRTTKRYDQLREALEACKADTQLLQACGADAQLIDELRSCGEAALADDRLMLYFQQGGKCMYSGEPLDINRLNEYQVDHIIPQAYICDDSLSNRVLVIDKYNQRKNDKLLLDEDVIKRRSATWAALQKAGLITEKKYRNLTRRTLPDRQLQGFINRQLVETSQIVKFVREMCEQRYPNTRVVSVRASVSSGIRANLGLVKCRDLNDHQHAHDAFLACQVARFVHLRYPGWEDGRALSYLKKYIKSLEEEAQRRGRRDLGRSGFIADSFCRRGVVAETGELWDGPAECARVRKAMSYRQCFISRMTEEQTGAFWDETVYSPRDTSKGRNLPVPLKNNHLDGRLSPSRYGGHQNVRTAYWFVYAARNQEDKWQFYFEGVPVYRAKAIDDDGLEAYAEECAAKHGCHGAVVLRKKVALRQKFSLDGTEYYLGGNSAGRNELIPAEQPSCRPRELKAVANALNGVGNMSPDDTHMVYEWLVGQVNRVDPLLAGTLELQSKFEAFMSLDCEQQPALVRAIVSRAAGATQVVDLSPIGGKTHGGHVMRNIGNSLPRITWIDQSVTGMYEWRTTFEDLCRGLS